TYFAPSVNSTSRAMPCRYQLSLPVNCRRSASLSLASLMGYPLSLLACGAAAAAPLPVGETGVASVRRLLRNRKSNEIEPLSRGNFVCLFGWKPLDVREGSALSNSNDHPGRASACRS